MKKKHIVLISLTLLFFLSTAPLYFFLFEWILSWVRHLSLVAPAYQEDLAIAFMVPLIAINVFILIACAISLVGGLLE